jgi:hypothetical protein
MIFSSKILNLRETFSFDFALASTSGFDEEKRNAGEKDFFSTAFWSRTWAR